MLKHKGKRHSRLVNWMHNKCDKKWEKMSDDTPTSELCTISDEAFVKVLLLNNWSMWIEINNKSDNKWRSDKRNGPKLEVEAKPKFSSKTSKRGETSQFKGWTSEGVELFNKIYALVLQDRETNGTNDQEWIKDTLKEYYERKKKQSRKRKAGVVAMSGFNEDEVRKNAVTLDEITALIEM